jgi:hypothetical protein
MFCPECGTENPPYAKFCYECGINLSEAMNSPEKILEDSEVVDGEVYPDTNETTESGKESESMNNNCIICKAGEMIPTIHRGSLGFGTKNILECNKCGAVFEKKGQKYKLSSISDTNQPIWIKYCNQTLSEEEWIRIRNGGISDTEQQKINTQRMEAEKQEIQEQKKNDIYQYLTAVQNGTTNITNNQPSPVILKKNENISIVMNNIHLQEPRAVRQTSAAYGGPTIRVAKGVSFRLGGASARSESHEEIRVIDQGSLILTNKRLIFIGSKRTTNIDLRKIMAIKAYKDGIESQRENKQKTEYFTGTDKSSITFTINSRQTTIPILGDVLKAAIEGAITQID